MLYAFFPELMNMSITAAAVILIVAVLRPLLRRTPRSVTFLLWTAVLFRLVCPVSFSSEITLFRGVQTVDSRIQILPSALLNDTLHLSSVQPSDVVAETITEAASGSLGRTDFVKLVMIAGAWIWIIGIAAFLVINGISLFRLHRKCIGAVEIEKRVYLADSIQTPFVLGIIRPKIYLPSTLSETERRDILLHEQMHIRRLDPLWKLIAFLALALHWFNPVVWFGFNLFVRDMETACDERVLRSMDQNARADYAETLLRLSTGRRFPRITPAFGEDNPKTRIKSILHYKKPIRIVTILAAVAAILLAVLLLANPQVKTGKAADVIPEFPQFDENLYYYSIGLQVQDAPTGWSYSGGHEEIAPMVYGFLQNLDVELNPASQSRAEDRDTTNSMYLMTSGTDKVLADFHFNRDFSRLWVDNGVKPSYTYVVKNPESVRELFAFLITGETKSLILDTAIEANRVAAEEGYLVAIYCPAATQTQGFIQVGELHASYVSAFLCTKLENEYGYDFDLGGLDWDETLPPKDTPASPESVEFVIRDNLRVQIWRNPRLAVIRSGNDETWYKTPYGDYPEAVELVRNYSLTPAEVQERLEAESESLLETETNVTPASTAVPTGTPSPTENPDATVQATTVPAPSAAPQPTPETAVKTS